MRRASDETLMAYADGMLEPDEHRAVDLVLAADAEARRVVWLFHVSRDIARLAFSAPMWQPAPHRHVLDIQGSTALAASQPAVAQCIRAGLAARRWGAALAGMIAVMALFGATPFQGTTRETGSDER